MCGVGKVGSTGALVEHHRIPTDGAPATTACLLRAAVRADGQRPDALRDSCGRWPRGRRNGPGRRRQFVLGEPVRRRIHDPAGPCRGGPIIAPTTTPTISQSSVRSSITIGRCSGLLLHGFSSTRVGGADLLSGNLVSALIALETNRDRARAPALLGALIDLLRKQDDEDLTAAFTEWVAQVLLPRRFGGSVTGPLPRLDEVRAMLAETVKVKRSGPPSGLSRAFRPARRPGDRRPY